MSPAHVELAFQCVVAGWVSVITEAARIRDVRHRAAYLAERRDHTLALLERLEAEAGAHGADQRILIQQAREAISRGVAPF